MPGRFHSTVCGQTMLPVGGAIVDDLASSASSASTKTDDCLAGIQSNMQPPQQTPADCMASLSAALSQMAEMQVIVILQHNLLAIQIA